MDETEPEYGPPADAAREQISSSLVVWRSLLEANAARRAYEAIGMMMAREDAKLATQNHKLPPGVLYQCEDAAAYCGVLSALLTHPPLVKTIAAELGAEQLHYLGDWLEVIVPRHVDGRFKLVDPGASRFGGDQWGLALVPLLQPGKTAAFGVLDRGPVVDSERMVSVDELDGATAVTLSATDVAVLKTNSLIRYAGADQDPLLGWWTIRYGDPQTVDRTRGLTVSEVGYKAL